jgi:hypothetical protein
MFQINWKLKSLLYKIFSQLKLNKTFYFIQKYVTKRSNVNIKPSVRLWKLHSENIKEYQIKTVLEIGAGKSLEQNIFFSYFFNNNLEQTVIDIKKMIDFDLVNEASKQISELLNVQKLKSVSSYDDLFNFYNIKYIAPYKTQNLIEEKKVFDLCVSTTTLEHFSIKDLRTLFKDLSIVLKKGGYISAVIDYSDHYSHTDRNISELNFLKYSEKQWQNYNNTYLYQNRLRHDDYVKLLNEYKFITHKIVQGNIGKPPENLNEKFDLNNKNNFVLWAYFFAINSN